EAESLPMKETEIAIVGAGSFGTALATTLAEKHGGVRLWARRKELADEIARTRRNPIYLGDEELSPKVLPTAMLDEAVRGAAFVIIAVPSHGIRAIVKDAGAELAKDATLVCGAKGIEAESLALMPDVLGELTASRRDVRLTYLSGPSFAAEIA